MVINLLFLIKKMDKDKDAYHYLDLEEYFSLEDYTTYKNYNFNTSSEIVNEFSVRVSFPEAKKNREVIENKNKAGYYNGNYLLNKINHMKYLKGAINTCLRIKEFPLVNKLLEEHEKDNNDNETDKIFYLKNNNEKLPNIELTLNNINNNNCNNNYNNNFNINNNYNNFNIKMKNNLSQMNYNNNINNIQNNNQINNNNNINIILNCFEEKSKQLFPMSGLNNLGLTSYMNSTLQCLLHIPELNNYFINIYPNQINNLNDINKEAETKGRLSEEYFKLVQKVQNNIGKENTIIIRITIVTFLLMILFHLKILIMF